MQLLLSCKAAVDASDIEYRPYPCIVDDSTLPIFCCIVPLHFLLISCCFRNATPLHSAAFKGHVEIVQLLLSRKAAVDASDSQYRPYPCIVDDNTLPISCRIVLWMFNPNFLLF